MIYDLFFWKEELLKTTKLLVVLLNQERWTRRTSFHFGTEIITSFYI